MSGINASVLLALAYAAFLALVATGLELLARHSHQRSRRVRTVGFYFQSDLDAWKCPDGKLLYRAEVTRESTAVRYRALAHECNNCALKSRCTDSDEGRVIEVQPDSWLQSELRKFHRGVSLMLLLLAAVILAITLAWQHNALAQALLAVPLLGIAGAGLRLGQAFFQSVGEKH